MPIGPKRDLWQYPRLRAIGRSPSEGDFRAGTKPLNDRVDRLLERDKLPLATKGTDMGVDLEVDKLTTNMTDQVDKLAKRISDVNDKLSGAFSETHDTLDVVETQVDKLNTVSARLKAIVGGQTNNPPPGDLPT